MQRNRLLPDRHGGQVRAAFDLVAPLAQQATDMPDTAVSRLIDDPTTRDLRPGDVECANERRTRTTAATPTSRTSGTATRIGITSPINTGLAPSADQTHTSHAGCSFEALVTAYFDCRRHKRNKLSAIAFEENLEDNLVKLYEELQSDTYRPGPTTCFIITRPKPREVWAADFRDRIVHHLVYNHIADRFQRSFIADSCACIPGRGTLYAAKRLEAKIRSITQNWTLPAFYLKCDLANFFISIDKRILDRLLAYRIHEPWWLALTRSILHHDPLQDVILESTPELMALIPAHKSLFNQPVHRGLPIGNLSSQFFANVYLDVLDQFIKHRIGARHYIRYVDDFLLLHESPQWLNLAHDQIAFFLPRMLAAQLNESKTILQPINRGVDFVGQVIRPYRRTLRRRTLRDANYRIEQMPRNDVFASANSYFGLLRQTTRSWRDRQYLTNSVNKRGHSVNCRLTKVRQ